MMSERDASVTSNPGCEWSYTGSTSPKHWGTLRHNGELCYPLCGSTTSQQSPIDLAGNFVLDRNMPVPVFNYTRTHVNVTLSHNNFAVNYPAGGSNTLSYNGILYNLLSFHFHHPSEHLQHALKTKIEVHLVHSAQIGDPPQTQSLVVGIFMDTPDAVRGDGKILKDVVDNVDKSFDVNAADLLSGTSEYYTYQGSMTTPDCAINVIWLLMNGAMPVYDDYVQDFKSALENKYNWGYNARDVQDQLDGTKVYTNIPS
jgi:carbonic anhydrase